MSLQTQQEQSKTYTFAQAEGTAIGIPYFAQSKDYTYTTTISWDAGNWALKSATLYADISQSGRPATIYLLLNGANVMTMEWGFSSSDDEQDSVDVTDALVNGPNTVTLSYSTGGAPAFGYAGTVNDLHVVAVFDYIGAPVPPGKQYPPIVTPLGSFLGSLTAADAAVIVATAVGIAVIALLLRRR